MVGNKKTKIYLNYPILMGIMDVKTIAFEKIKPLREDVLLQLGKIEAQLNYLKQRKFKTKVQVQRDIVSLNYDKQFFKKMMKEIEKRLDRGW